MRWMYIVMIALLAMVGAFGETGNQTQTVGIIDTLPTSCPASEDQPMMWMIIILLFGVLMMGFVLHPIFALLASIGLVLYSGQLVQCSYVFGIIMFFTSMGLLIMSMFMKWWK